MKLMLKNIVLSVLVLLCLLFLLELFFRLIYSFNMNYDIEMYKYAVKLKQTSQNSELIHEHKPNTQAKIMGVNVRINNFGMRGKDISIEKLQNEKRVLCLGASATFGWGVEENDTYVSKLEKKYKKQNNNIIFINSGVGNYNAKMSSILLKQNFSKINPDAILFTYSINNAETITSQYNNSLIRNSYLYAISYIGVQKLVYMLKYKNKISLGDYYTDVYNSFGWIVAKKAILDMRNFCLEKKVPFIVVVFPEVGCEDEKFVKIYKKINEFLILNNIKYFDISKFYDANNIDLWVSKKDRHPNIKGHQILSDIIYNCLQKENFISILNKN